ncbi:MAG: hypothetical protein FWG46_01630 [Treponema sp.]|nr:hypothetical protein [Treponema sp.]
MSISKTSSHYFPQHFLYFFPLPQGHGSFLRYGIYGEVFSRTKIPAHSLNHARVLA